LAQQTCIGGQEKALKHFSSKLALLDLFFSAEMLLFLIKTFAAIAKSN
jgi:hypothetical protein